MSFRSLLFVPGSRPERFEKARAAGADAVCVDLEDAVAPQDKPAARDAVAAYLAADNKESVGVRVNGAATTFFTDDLKSLACGAAFVMLPKAETPEAVARVRQALPDVPVWLVIETCEGLRRAYDLAAVEGVAGLLFGGADYAAEIGTDLSFEPLLFARGALVAAAARSGRELLDVPYINVRDESGLIAETRRVKALGFTGRACIHPGQVAAVNGVYTAAAEEVDRARRVLQAFEAAKGGAALLDGKLIELPVVRAARRILERQ